MKENYLMSIHSCHEIEGEKDIIDMTAMASLEGEADNYYITYVEDDGDSEETKTTLHVENKRCVTIRREGAFNSHMIIEKDVRHVSQHITSYGSFMLGVSAIGIDSKIKKEGGTLNFKYCTDLDMVPIGEIEFNITLTLQQ